MVIFDNSEVSLSKFDISMVNTTKYQYYSMDINNFGVVIIFTDGSSISKKYRLFEIPSESFKLGEPRDL